MFKKLTDHTYFRPHQGFTDRPNIGLIIGGKYTLLYDAGNSLAHAAQLKQELLQQNLPMPDFIVFSHWHWDHTYGAHGWNLPCIAGHATNNQLIKMSQWSWDDFSMEKRVEANEEIRFCTEMIKREYPDRSEIRVTTADIIFDGKMTVDLGGGITCELIHSKGPHSDDSVICYVPSDNFVFLGDSNGKDLYNNPWHFDLEHEHKMKQILMNIPYD